MTSTTKELRPETTLCIVAGDLTKEYLLYKGAPEICLVIFLDKYFPEFCIKYRKLCHDEHYQYPEKLIWLKTNENVERDILKKWKEAKSQQTPDLDE